MAREKVGAKDGARDVSQVKEVLGVKIGKVEIQRRHAESGNLGPISRQQRSRRTCVWDCAGLGGDTETSAPLSTRNSKMHSELGVVAGSEEDWR